ncbi:hypothetical protein YC2023_030774 [Brassica napus]
MNQAIYFMEKRKVFTDIDTLVPSLYKDSNYLEIKGRDFNTSKTIMEEPFLPRDEELVPGKTTWQKGHLTVELKKLSLLAAPMAIVTIAEYLLPVISVIVAGHNGELQLSGVALATSFTNVSGFSILVITMPKFSPL